MGGGGGAAPWGRAVLYSVRAQVAESGTAFTEAGGARVHRQLQTKQQHPGDVVGTAESIAPPEKPHMSPDSAVTRWVLVHVTI